MPARTVRPGTTRRLDLRPIELSAGTCPWDERFGGWRVQMRIAIFSAQAYERALLDGLNVRYGHELVYFDTLLGPETTSLATGFPAVSVFVNDIVDANALKHLADGGTKLVATRSTG